MSPKGRPAPPPPARRTSPAPRADAQMAAVPPLPFRHPALLASAVVAALAIALSVSFEIYEKDFWQHLLVGKAIFQLGRVPQEHLWTWPMYGTPDVLPSWAFRVLIWPVWNAGGVAGLFGWRWVTTLLAFGLMWATARRIGARGLTPLVVLVLCSLTYRQRSQVRPETLVAMLFALQIWILETRRHGGPDRSWWLVPIAWAWANVHISYHLGFAMLGAHILDAHLRARRGVLDRPGRLWAVALAAAAASFLNPFGWRALWQPFDFFLHQRHEPIFKSIFELMPLPLAHNLRNGLPLVLFGWPLLMLWRWRRGGFDRVETLCWAGFAGLSFLSQRFLGFAMIVAAPYLARDLDQWVRSRRWPAWTSPAWNRAALAAGACAVIGIPEWSRTDLPMAIGIDYREYPVVACDFMARHGIGGRGFNQFFNGGYLLHRFWPDRELLPYMDIHQSGTPRDRYDYAFLGSTPDAWRNLHARRGFDYALLRRMPYGADAQLEFLDADSTWVPVFMDDAAALYLRRDGPHRALAERFAYRVASPGTNRMVALSQRVAQDSALRARITAELEREVAGSPYNALALTRLGSTAIVEGDRARARAYLERALRSDPRAQRAREWLGLIAIAEGRPREALRLFDEEHRLNAWVPGYHFRRGQAWQALGDLGKARAGYQREVRANPTHAEARDSLAAIEARIGGS